MVQPNAYTEPQKRKMSKKSKVFLVIAAIIFAAVVAAAVYFFLQYNTLKANPDTVAVEKTERLTKEVSAIYSPPDETPTIAEISDKEKLKDQQFFDNAENGDYLLIYPNAKQALIYRESAKKLVNVGPISIADENAGAKKE
jgi:hypothetical protein